jgi:hypothetical protein
LEPNDFLKRMGVWGLRPQRVQGSALAFLSLIRTPIGRLPHGNILPPRSDDLETHPLPG